MSFSPPPPWNVLVRIRRWVVRNFQIFDRFCSQNSKSVNLECLQSASDSGVLRPPDLIQAFRTWTPLGDFLAPDPLPLGYAPKWKSLAMPLLRSLACSSQHMCTPYISWLTAVITISLSVTALLLFFANLVKTVSCSFILMCAAGAKVSSNYFLGIRGQPGGKIVTNVL